MTIENPPVFEHGFVVGRFVTSIADTLADDDRYPDLRPIEGRVRFTPLQAVHLKGGEHPATVVKQPVTVQLDEAGYLSDVESRNDPSRPTGLYLAAGLYRVEPIFDSVSSISRFTIEVTAGHTKDAPLDLTLAAPLETPPGFTEVVRIEDRVRAEDAAETAEGHTALALVYRDDAQDSAATADAHRVSAGENAGYAEAHADRAETARDETLAQAIEVDTSAGTKVIIGGHVVHYDSGWRDVTANTTVTVLEGRILLRRTLTETYVQVEDLIVDASGTSTIIRVPYGFRPGIHRQGFWHEDVNRAPRADWRLSDAGYLVFYQIPSDDETPINATVIAAMRTMDTPTTLPGTPA